jgi:hypothetical protein
MVGLVVRADHEIVEGKTPAENVVHAVELATGLVSAGEPRLIGGDDQDKAGFLEHAQGWFGLLLNTKFLQSERRDLILRPYANLVEDPVPFDENSFLHNVAKPTSPYIIGTVAHFRSLTLSVETTTGEWLDRGIAVSQVLDSLSARGTSGGRVGEGGF